jgi:hypothetical protein
MVAQEGTFTDEQGHTRTGTDKDDEEVPCCPEHFEVPEAPKFFLWNDTIMKAPRIKKAKRIRNKLPFSR